MHHKWLFWPFINPKNVNSPKNCEHEANARIRKIAIHNTCQKFTIIDEMTFNNSFRCSFIANSFNFKVVLAIHCVNWRLIILLAWDLSINHKYQRLNSASIIFSFIHELVWTIGWEFIYDNECTFIFYLAKQLFL